LLSTIAGLLNSGLVFISLFAIYAQWATIRRRRQQGEAEPTELLSLNQSVVSYFAYLSFFIYGFSITPFNHYLVWPRLIASLMTLVIIFEIWRDRRTSKSSGFALLTVCFLLISLYLLVNGNQIADDGKLISTGLIVIVTIFLAQGYAHQIYLIIKHGKTGAIDIRLSQSIFFKDCSTLFLAYSLGFIENWPLVLLAIVSATTKIIIMYLFYWVRTIPVALERNEKL